MLTIYQGRNEVYGIIDQRPKKGWDQGSQPLIRDHSPRDRDQYVFHAWAQRSDQPSGVLDNNNNSRRAPKHGFLTLFEILWPILYSNFWFLDLLIDSSPETRIREY